MNSSPFQALFVVRHHAEENREAFPRAAEAILDSTYMDDTMDSVESEEEGVEMYDQLSCLWKMAGMHARKWISNNKGVLERIPLADRVMEIDLQKGELPEVKTLGVSWKADPDLFTFHHSVNKSSEHCTKRTLLSSIALLFDPLGMLSPFTIRGKILLQEVWVTGVDWDDQFPPSLRTKIEEWYAELKLVERFSIPRCVREDSEVETTSLHFFCDASEHAYAVVGYVVCTYANGRSSSRQVISKAKVSPLKTISIPRLELIGAVMSVKIAPVVAKAMEISPLEIHYWSDSTNVLWWIHRRSRIFKTFVANRVSKIQQASSVSLWRHVPTDQNPADLGTRGANIETLAQNKLWRNGPEFLLDPSSWPVKDFSSDEHHARSEVKSNANLTYYSKTSVNAIDSGLDPTRYSSRTRLLRVAAWVFRFSNNCRCPNKLTGNLTVDELADSENMLIRSAQMIDFADEFKELTFLQ